MKTSHWPRKSAATFVCRVIFTSSSFCESGSTIRTHAGWSLWFLERKIKHTDRDQERWWHHQRKYNCSADSDANEDKWQSFTQMSSRTPAKKKEEKKKKTTCDFAETSRRSIQVCLKVAWTLENTTETNAVWPPGYSFCPEPPSEPEEPPNSQEKNRIHWSLQDLLQKSRKGRLN